MKLITFRQDYNNNYRGLPLTRICRIVVCGPETSQLQANAHVPVEGTSARTRINLGKWHTGMSTNHIAAVLVHMVQS